MKVLNGKIKLFDNDRGFGFVSSGNIDHFFHISTYQKKFKEKLPILNENVCFSTRERGGRVEIDGFHTQKSSFLQCDRFTFKNFVEIDNDSLYYVYSIDEQKADEIYKFNPNELSQSIACYKDDKIHNNFRLQAINSLIESGYSDRNIKKQLLQNKKNIILNNLLLEHLKKGNYQKALEYELLIQEMKYDPIRLNKFKNMKSEYKFNFQKELNVETLKDREIWNIDVYDNVKIDDGISIRANSYLLDIETPIVGVEPVVSNEEWNIDLKNDYKVKRVRVENEEFNLELEKSNMFSRVF